MNKRSMTLILTGLIVSTIISTSLFAQTTSTTTPTDPTRTPAINEIKGREQIQDQRFQQGVNSGAISATTATQDKASRQQFNSNLKSAAQANGGHLTAAQTVQANHHLNKASKTLYNQKH
jgi:glutaminase